MADVYAVFGTLIALSVAYPGLLSAWRMMLPAFVERAQIRISSNAWGSFGLGAGLGLPVIFGSAFLVSVPAPFLRFLGVTIAVCALSLASLGAAGLAGLMGSRLNDLSDNRYTMPGAQVRGAVALELAAIFPLVGWLLVFPLGTLTCFGAGVLALFLRPNFQDKTSQIHAPQTGEA